MGARELTAFALLPFIIAGIVLLPAWVYLAAIWLVALAAAWELLAMFRRLGHPVMAPVAMAGIGAALPAIWLTGMTGAGTVLAILVVAIPTLYLLTARPLQGAGAGISTTTFATLYVAVTAAAMGLLRTVPGNPAGWKLVLLTCICIWGGDSGAYYLGSRFGRHRMAPRVSPKKSWEGAAGGVLGTFVGLWICHAVFFPELGLRAALVLGAVLSVVAPVGDLVESLFKRDAGVKDSSALIPGHGGFLDRTDSLFFAAPFVLATFLLLGMTS